MAISGSVVSPTFISNFSSSVAASLIQQYPANLAGIPASEIATAIQQILPQVWPQTVSLVKTRPDYESVLSQLMNAIEQSNTWADSDMSATGQMILRLLATDIDYGQFSIARALQECYLDSARSDNSVFLAARMLGNRLSRNLPCSTTVNFTRVDVVAIAEFPIWTQFTMNSVGSTTEISLFNRDPLIFANNTPSATINLYEGVVQTTSMTSNGTAFQAVEFGTETGTISDVDIQVLVDGVMWTRVTDPIWHYAPTDNVYYENTLQNGNVSVQFGDGRTGAAPPLNSIITINWIETQGTAGASAITGQQVQFANTPAYLGSYTGTNSTPLGNGIDALNARFFRLFASNRRAAQQRAVRRSDYRALVVGNVAGVYDAHFRGQAEIAPGRPSYMNIIEATLLTVPPFTDAQWNNFVTYVNSVGIFQCVVLRKDPTILTMNLAANIYCNAAADLATVQAQVTTNIQNYMQPTEGSLGYSLYNSDFVEMIENGPNVQNLIEYSEVLSPGGPIVCTGVDQWIQLGTITLNMFYTRRGTDTIREINGLSTGLVGGLTLD